LFEAEQLKIQTEPLAIPTVLKVEIACRFQQQEKNWHLNWIQPPSLKPTTCFFCQSFKGVTPSLHSKDFL